MAGRWAVGVQRLWFTRGGRGWAPVLLRVIHCANLARDGAGDWFIAGVGVSK